MAGGRQGRGGRGCPGQHQVELLQDPHQHVGHQEGQAKEGRPPRRCPDNKERVGGVSRTSSNPGTPGSEHTDPRPVLGRADHDGLQSRGK